MRLFTSRFASSWKRFLAQVSCLSFLLAITQLSGFVQAETEHQKNLREAYERSLDADKKGIDKEIAYFKSVLGNNQKDALARAYLGSAHALRARESFWGATKKSHLEQAKKELNQAVKDAPDDPLVRMVRAITAYKIPKKFGQRKQAIEDFGHVIAHAKKEQSELTLRQRQAILYYAALCYKEEGHAGHEELLKLCHELDPHSDLGKLAGG